MKNILFTIVLSVLTIIVIAGMHTNDIVVNQTSSTVKWTGSKPAGKHSGTIDISRGKLVFDHGKLVGGEIIIDMNSIKNTDIEGRRKERL